MKNYICLNGVKTELTQEQVSEMQKPFGVNQIRLSEIPEGETFKIWQYEFVVLEQGSGTTAVILKELLHEEKHFGSNNNFDGSNVDELCAAFASEIAGIIDMDNLIEHTVDLTSDDGLKDYGKVKRRMSLITTELYRRYVNILDKYKSDKWWWLATPYSTPTHDETYWVKCVSPGGRIGNGICGSVYGVRPFCILKSNIFVSK